MQSAHPPARKKEEKKKREEKKNGREAIENLVTQTLGMLR